jgi:hypothetical protein
MSLIASNKATIINNVPHIMDASKIIYGGNLRRTLAPYTVDNGRILI